MPFSFEADVEQALRQAFAAAGVQPATVLLRRIPFNDGWGFATQLALAQGRGKDGAQALASEVAGRLESSGDFQRVEAVNGFVNVYVDAAQAGGHVLQGILTDGDRYGAGEPTGMRCMVEYSQPNTHKEFHVGHLRNAAFGNAIVRLLRFSGADVLAANYIGDIGAHVIRCLWCLRKYHATEQPPEDRLDWLGGIYTEAVRRIEADEPGAKEEVAQLFARWEASDPDLQALWRETKQWCMDELHRIYRQLDVWFDVWFYESEVEAEGKAMAQDLIAKGVAEFSEGLPIVRLGDKLGVLPILRSDGTSLYQTKELALSVEKFRKYDVQQAIVVTDVSQSLYFKQVFKVLELYGFEHAKDLAHLPYERVNLPEGKMASRSGNIVAYEELAAEAIRRVACVITEKNPGLGADDRARVAEEVAISALKFVMVSVGNTSVITFDWERVLDFDGYTGPYLQYAYVRASRILAKAAAADLPQNGPDQRWLGRIAIEPEERTLLQTLSEFPREVARGADQRAPVIIANYVHKLAKEFSAFYHLSDVIHQSDDETRRFRIALVACVKQVLANGLNLLGLSLPESM
ncbi:MAG TPA: arginine--tRNA ligase [Chloroflexota bacterium]|nr:arginine--tRNA ligase [Chloroflexota bacterium]